jgi:glycosyltransferase involved in cell wall biosynthesis
MKKVSIIIPTYNQSQYLSEAIDSVLAQNYKDSEIIIVNDGSTDSTEKIIKHYQQKYPEKIKYFYKKNGGQASARNLGMKNAQGEHFAFLDADDLWLPEKLEKQINKLQESNADICYTDAEMFGNELVAGKRFSEIAEFHEGKILKELIKTNFIVNSSVLMKRLVFEKVGFQKKFLKRVEDYEYWLRVALNNFQLVFIGEPLVLYRVHEEHTTKKGSRKTYFYLAMIFGKLLFHFTVWKRGLFFNVLRMFLISLKNLLWKYSTLFISMTI